MLIPLIISAPPCLLLCLCHRSRSISGASSGLTSTSPLSSPRVSHDPLFEHAHTRTRTNLDPTFGTHVGAPHFLIAADPTLLLPSRFFLCPSELRQASSAAPALHTLTPNIKGLRSVLYHGIMFRSDFACPVSVSDFSVPNTPIN